MRISLNKYIAKSGLCSRRKATELIKEGRILVNGKIVDQSMFVDDEIDIVTYNQQVIRPQPKKVYIKLNKPQGYISSVKDEKGRKTVVDLVNVEERVFPVGRLDYNSKGLIILTNDGDLANRLTHPKFHLPKEYHVTIKGGITNTALQKLANGVEIDDGYLTKKADVKRIGKEAISITLYEGRNRQIRKMCAVLGLKITELKRVRIGDLKLGQLKEGEYEFFDPALFTLAE